MEERKWEDLDVDCLVNVFRRVGLDSLLFDVPFVCKSWHEASLHPSCWEHPVSVEAELEDGEWNYSLIQDRFRDVYGINNFSWDAFIKFIVDRSHGKATILYLSYCSNETVKYAADNCPALRMLWLSGSGEALLAVIRKWKYLEGLKLLSCDNLVAIASEISLECKNFVGLRIQVPFIVKEEALAIVTYLPKIKYLFLAGAVIDRENLIIILQGCKELVHLDVANARGFEADDKILELASHIPKFILENMFSGLRYLSPLEPFIFDEYFLLNDDPWDD